MPRNKKSKSKSKSKKHPKSAPTSPSKPASYLTGSMLGVPLSGMPRSTSSASSGFETDDSISLCSEMIIDEGEVTQFELENEELDVLNALEDFDSMGEPSRQVALKTVFNKLAHRLHEEFLSNQLPLMRGVIASTISPTRGYKEIELGCRVAAIVAISLPDNDREHFVNDMLIDLLTDLIRNATSVGSEATAIDTLSFLCYFGGNADAMENVVDLLCGIWQSTHHDETHPKVVNAALCGWTFLMSKLPCEALVEFLHDKMDVLMAMMKSSTTDLTIRISLGECVSLYCDAWASSPSEIRSNFAIDLSQIRRDFESISNETNRRRRVAMRQQRSKFRQFLKAVPQGPIDDEEIGEDLALVAGSAVGGIDLSEEAILHERMHKWRPKIKLRFRSRDFEFEGWDRFIEYHRMKDMLGSGTQTHLFWNPRLQAVFDLEGIGEEMMEDGPAKDKEVKKRVFEDNARRQKDDRKRGRRDKFERNNHFEDNSIW